MTKTSESASKNDIDSSKIWFNQQQTNLDEPDSGFNSTFTPTHVPKINTALLMSENERINDSAQNHVIDKPISTLTRNIAYAFNDSHVSEEDQSTPEITHDIGNHYSKNCER